MKINHTLHLDLVAPGLPLRIQATQDDSISHVLHLHLKEQGRPWPIPADATVLIHFRKSDRTGGIYDTLPDGSAAWQIRDNRLQLTLAPQVLTAPGETALAVTLVQGSNRLTIARILLQIAACPGFAGASESYSYVSAFLPQPITAAPGQLLQVKEVNEQGVVLSTEAVSGASGGGIGSAAGSMLLSLLQKAVYTEDVSADLAALQQQLGGETPAVTLTSIEAVYTGSTVYAGSDVQLLQNITVTACYSDGTTRQVKNFTLSGTLNEGSNTITVHYGGCTDTVTVIGIPRPADQYAVYNNLSFATNSNTATAVSAGGSYSCIIKAQSGYDLKRVLITMGDTTVFEENYTTAPLECSWSTDNVTGDIIITAVAQAQVSLSRLSATYTGGSVPEGTKLSALTGITVTAHYSDGTTQPLAGGYGLSGTIGAGSNTITVSYGGVTTTFTVVGIQAPATYSLVNDWDFTASLTDSVGGVTAQLGNATQDETGVHFAEMNSYIQLTQQTRSICGKRVEIDIASGELTLPEGHHGRLFSVGPATTINSGGSAFTWRYNTAPGRAVYGGHNWAESVDSTAYPVAFFHGKTIRLDFDEAGHLAVSYANLGEDTFTPFHSWSCDWVHTTGHFIIGCSASNILYPITFRAVRIYEEV